MKVEKISPVGVRCKKCKCELSIKEVRTTARECEEDGCLLRTEKCRKQLAELFGCEPSDFLPIKMGEIKLYEEKTGFANGNVAAVNDGKYLDLRGFAQPFGDDCY